MMADKQQAAKDGNGGGGRPEGLDGPGKRNGPAETSTPQAQAPHLADPTSTPTPASATAPESNPPNPSIPCENLPERPVWSRTDTESSLPPHHRQSVVNIPVTPGIGLRTYSSSSPEPNDRDASGSPSYFQFKPSKDVIASPDSLDDNMAAASSSAPDAAAPESGHDVLRRISQSRGRGQSIAMIKNEFPTLPLSGNVISATFSIPHSLKYRKGSDWVSLSAASIEGGSLVQTWRHCF